jgi:hypothetical protein
MKGNADSRSGRKELFGKSPPEALIPEFLLLYIHV